MIPEPISRRARPLCACFLVASVLYHLVAGIGLNRHLPDDFPNGGPDEPMHISVSRFISDNLRWPHWDAEELHRYDNGTSYATSSSLGYWIDGLLLRLGGRSRLSALLFFLGYLALAVWCFRRSTVAGLFALAAITPQFLFVCSYVNSDAWTAIVALTLGFAVSRFQREPARRSSVFFLFAAAGACISCRFHMWPMGFLAMMWVLVPRLRNLAFERPRQALAGLAIGVAIASWWPLTSYFANDGDIIGFEAQRRSEERFGTPNLPSLSRPWSEFKLAEFTRLTATSFYGVWGWLNFRLAWGWYLAAAVVGLPLLAYFWWRRRSLFALQLVLPVVNFALMLIYSTQYDYQWQGRYMFPWYFLSVGIVLDGFASEKKDRTENNPHWLVVPLLIGFSAINIYSEVRLWSDIERAEQIDPTQRGYFMLEQRQFYVAGKDFARALERDSSNVAAINGSGLVAWRIQDLDRAEIQFRDAVRLAPADVQSRVNLADLLMERQRYAEAIENYEAIERKDARSVSLQMRLALANKQRGDFDAALRHCKRASQLAPSDQRIRRTLDALEREAAAAKAGKP